MDALAVGTLVDADVALVAVLAAGALDTRVVTPSTSVATAANMVSPVLQFGQRINPVPASEKLLVTLEASGRNGTNYQE